MRALDQGHNVCITGYEVLPSLHSVSVYLKSKYKIPNEQVEFVHADMLTADLSKTNILVLTSMCWDKDTRKKVAEKCITEMKKGAIVVDYRKECFSDFGYDETSNVYGKNKKLKTSTKTTTKTETKTKTQKSAPTLGSQIRNTSVDTLMSILDLCVTDFMETEYEGKIKIKGNNNSKSRHVQVSLSLSLRLKGLFLYTVLLFISCEVVH